MSPTGNNSDIVQALDAIRAAISGPYPTFWWQELGRASLTSPSDTISLSDIQPKKYLKILVHTTGTGGTSQIAFQFNGDTGANYARRASADGGAESALTSITSASTGSSNSDNVVGEFECFNVETSAKYLIGHVTFGNNAATTAPSRNDNVLKWANTTSLINRIDLVNLGTGDFATGSELVVLGHD